MNETYYVKTEEKEHTVKIQNEEEKFYSYDGELVEDPTGTLVEKTIIENGEYLPASDNADGYSKVTVNVPNLLVGLFDGTLQNIAARDLSGLTKLHTYAIAENGILLTIELPDSVTQLEDYAIYYCNQLQRVTIGSGITSFGYQALAYSQNLQSITIKAVTPPIIQSNTFTSTNSCPIYVPAESVEAYKAATNWASLASRIFAIQE